MTPPRLVVVSERAVEAVIDWPMARDAVRRAFEAAWRGEARVFPTLAVTGVASDEFVNVKAGAVGGDRPLVGHKTGVYWPRNPGRGLPAHGAATLLLDPADGRPAALLSASLMNRYRTAAADATAVDLLARPDSRVLGVIGGGAQGEYEIRAILTVRPIGEVRIADRNPDAAGRLKARLSDLPVEVRVADFETAVRGVDILVTATPATLPVLDARWVGEGVHVSAMGADRKGKGELDLALLQRARLFADFPEQSLDIGEFQRLAGSPRAAEITAIGAVLVGVASGRADASEVTVFDSSGLAAQDLLIAAAVLERAQAQGLCQEVAL